MTSLGNLPSLLSRATPILPSPSPLEAHGEPNSALPSRKRRPKRACGRSAPPQPRLSSCTAIPALSGARRCRFRPRAAPPWRLLVGGAPPGSRRDAKLPGPSAGRSAVGIAIVARHRLGTERGTPGRAGGRAARSADFALRPRCKAQLGRRCWVAQRGLRGLMARCAGLVLAGGPCSVRGRRGEIGGNGGRYARGGGPWREEGG